MQRNLTFHRFNAIMTDMRTKEKSMNGKRLKHVGWTLVICSIVVLAVWIPSGIIANYKWENTYASAWYLGIKQSSIADKQKYVLEFKDTLLANKANFSENNAIFLATPNNSFDKNLQALDSLSSRLTQIQSMDPTSFQYNTAIEQITKQEQDEAGAMIGVFEGCWYLHNYPYLWNWIGRVIMVSCVVAMFAGGIMLLAFWVECH